jgi:hypothetical protein
MDQVEPLHPANAEAIAEFTRETGAEVLGGALRYPSKSGGWQLGDTDSSEHNVGHIGPLVERPNAR